MDPARRRPSVRPATGPVVSRALQIFEAFGPQHTSLTLTDLARRAGLPLSTVHRLAAELVAWGALERDAAGRYNVGLRLWEVAALAPRGQGLRERALPYLEDLSQVTQENVQLAVREGSELVFVERIAGSRAVPVHTRVGGRFALSATGVGLVLLAHAPREVQQEILSTTIERFTPHTITDPQVLFRMLADVRTNGFAVSDRQVTVDALSVAAPIRDRHNAVIAAVSLVVRYGSFSPHALSPLVRSSARAISRALAASD
ncbi:IclR family transcriptional regulator [Actinoplanes sp. NPDC049802]|uniref:IclR family transcriptional regulator n=1 Tax=Actinoplanes sp. NPDC049802 TaxID=3154742 RepID=UPI0033E2FEA1